MEEVRTHLSLPNPVTTCLGLDIILRVPVRVKNDANIYGQELISCEGNADTQTQWQCCAKRDHTYQLQLD